MNNATAKSESANQPAPPETVNRKLRQLELGFFLFAILLGFAHVWSDHHYLKNADAMSYLDVADAYLRRDWHSAINAYWGPLYSWLIAITYLITRPSPYWKFAVLHLLNFGIYLFAFGCFWFFMREAVSNLRSRRVGLLTAGFVVLPDWALLMLGYSLFIWASLLLITVSVESPDMLVAAVMYLATGLLLRIRRNPSSWFLFALLGITLGAGYLVKAVMLPMSAAFIVAAVISVGSLRQALPRVAVAVVFLLLLAGPFVFALSKSKGRFTTGGTGKLAYLWSINQIPNNHWQGEPPGYGTPIHPTRKIVDNPPSFEFGDSIGGTYPVWYDATYWFEGSVNHFNLRRQISVFVSCIQSYYDIFQSWGVQYALLVGLLTFYFMSGKIRSLVSDLVQHSAALVPAIAGLGLYSLVAVEKRYVASFIVLLWLALFSPVRLPRQTVYERLLKVVAIVLVVAINLTTLGSSVRETSLAVRQLVVGEDPAAHDQWQVAEGLREMGLTSGDKVASIGDSFRAFWAYLLGVRIVAEVRRNEIVNFWKANSTVKSEVLNAFTKSGAKAVVAESPPPGTDLSGWQRIRETDYYVYVLLH